MARKDATGHMRGAGTYSRSYPKLVKPKLNPGTARDVYGDVSEVGYHKQGKAAPVSGAPRAGGGKPGHLDKDHDAD